MEFEVVVWMEYMRALYLVYKMGFGLADVTVARTVESSE